MASRVAQPVAVLLVAVLRHASAGGLRGAGSEVMGYTFYANSNAYEGHGAVDLGRPSFVASVEQCVDECTREAGCGCATYGYGRCYLYTMCEPAAFYAPTQEYDVYVKTPQGHLQEPAFDAFAYYPDANTWAAPGLADGNLDEEGVPNLTPAECTLRCVATAACGCVVFEPSTTKCWMRRGCLGLQQGPAAKAYTVYNKTKAAKCVQSPQEYERTYAAGKEKCVSPSLLVSANAQGISPYAQPGFLFAWANTNVNLEMILRLNRLYNLSSPLKVALGVSSIAGLDVSPRSLEDDGLLGHLGVYTLPAGEQASTPSLGFWFAFLAEYGMSVDIEVQKELVEAYQFVEAGGDVVSAYASVVNCSREAVLNFSSSCGAIQDVTELCPDAYDNLLPSPECFRRLFDARPNPTAAEVRVALQRCQDNNQLQTFMGYGYNSYPFPLDCRASQTVDERYTGKEVVLRNRNFTDFPEYADVPLQGVDDIEGLMKLSDIINESGWCAGEKWWPAQ